MKAIISEIVLFSHQGERRRISFNQGLNIITGDSKTGKSALIEIVDYCLFSKRSTIPVGKVTDWTEIFCVIYQLNNKKLIIARPKNTLQKCYFSVETDFDTEKLLNRSYFDSQSLKDINKAQLSFEQHLGLSVSTTRTSSEQMRTSHSKATIRDASSIMFQHQNLIANKHSIFYRFDDYYKRSKVISDFPIHLGWADGDYFLLKREQEEILKKLKRRKNNKITEKKERDYQINLIKEPIEFYYKSLNLVLDESNFNLKRLKFIAENLPSVPNTAYENSDIENQVLFLKKERVEHQKELTKLTKYIDRLSCGTSDAFEYDNTLSTILDITHPEIQTEKKVFCPLCETESKGIQLALNKVSESHNVLKQELARIGTFKRDSSEYLEKLLKDRQETKRKIRSTTLKIRQLENAHAISKNSDLSATLYTLRGMIASNLKIILDESKENLKEEHEESSLAERLFKIEERIAGYDLKAKIQKANELINTTMEYLKEKLDFEEELRDGEMRFDLSTFDFHYFYKKKKIMLSEMGSGANWLACHLAIFLSLLRLSVREKSSLPAVLFIDQPSQVYFPKVRETFSTTHKDELLIDEQEEKVDENIKQVVNIFTVINDFLDYLVDKEGLKYKPQVIVLEHADEPSLSPFIRERWSKNGQKLI
ncbi:DUF3732 domain-containing protein [Vibrio sp. CUB2]|uniref:DUF3732 domain-containing protein n=1 Tax=Vibrio sp. CUB2 TaxID=2315233 RepID=UPI000769A5D0|nr:DUF3732 domain-containing protein [Vibrio sp. CUB2]